MVINFVDSVSESILLLKKIEKIYIPLNNFLMTNELVKKTNKPLVSRLKFFPLKSKKIILL